MSIYQSLLKRHDEGRPVRVALIGAGKFGSMFLSQVPHTPGLEVSVICDLSPDRAKAACRQVGWDQPRMSATRFSDDAISAVGRFDVDVVVEATGNPAAGLRHARAAIKKGKHVVMVNVEADVLVGPLLAEEARSIGVVYSLAYGDQPALTAEIVDWARASGFGVVAAGKGTKYLPAYHQVTPDNVWEHYGFSNEEAAAAGLNPQMFNSFLDGTKSAIEMAALANATGSMCRAGAWRFRLAAPTICPTCCAPRAPAACSSKQGSSKSYLHWRGMEVPFIATCVGASMQCSRPRTTTRPAAFVSTG